jgi:hypothetical protein
MGKTLNVPKMSYNDSILTGKDFEDYTEKKFPPQLYRKLHRTPAFDYNNFDLKALSPDFRFEIIEDGKSFWVECKYRGNGHGDSIIPVFRNDQLYRYKSHTNSFLFLCTHYYGEQLMFFVPIKTIDWNNLFLSFLDDYRVDINLPIMPSVVKKYIN